MQIKNLSKKLKKATICALSALTCFSVIAAVGALAPKADEGQVDPQTEVSAVSPSSLWTPANSITVNDDGDVPTWAKNGWRVHKADWVSVAEEYLTEDQLPENRKKGVKVTSTSETSRLEYKNVINIDGFTKDDALVEFVPITNFRVSSANFTGMKIWITDADDASNWICVNMYAVDAQYGGATRIEAETSTGINAAYRWGTYHDRNYVSTFYEGGRRDFYNAVKSSYYDQLNEGGRNSLYDIMYEPFGVYYDVEDKSVWVSGTTYGAKACLLDLDDIEYAHVNENNAFGGFTNNRVKIAFQTYNIVDSAEYVILNVANNPMNGTAVVDTTQPEYLETLPEGGVPTASVGKPYKAFDLEFYDFYDGAIEAQIFVKEESETDFGNPIPGSFFIPETQSRYTLRYVATDKAGNSAIVDYPIFAQYALPKIELAFNDSLREEYKVGEKVVFPTANMSGGSGPLTLAIKVTRLSDGAEISHNGNEFVPFVAGEYSITYEVKDYVGNVSTESLLCRVTSYKTPIYSNELIMYKKFVTGVPVLLPEVDVYDYDSVVGQRVKAKTEIVVSSIENPSVKETVSNYVFTPTIEKFGSKVLVEYISYCEKYPENKQVESFEVDLIEAKYSWDYLWNEDNSTISCNTQYEREKYASVTATTAGDVTVGFINPLQAENFTLQFDAAKDKDLFTALQLELVDFLDSSIRLQVLIQKDPANPNKTYVIYNGTKLQMTGAFGQDAQLVLTYANGKLTDYTNDVVANFGDFKGFSSGKVWCSVTMLNASEGACLKLKKIGSHSLFANYRASQTPPLQLFKDTVQPTIVLSQATPSDVKINTQVFLPTAVAYDACTPYLETTVTLLAPNGNYVYQNVDASEVHSFIADEYGVYTVTYTSKDKNNTKNATYEISVYDLTKPVIVYYGESSYACRVGDTLTFETIEAYDAVDEELTICLFVISPNGIMKTLGEDRQFKFEKTGTYTLRYYVYDSNYNFEMLDVEVKVGV